MRTTINRKPRSVPRGELARVLAAKLVGQPGAVEAVVPFVQTFQAQLAPEDRPAGVFLLLGPTGTGKTRTVECLAEALHGSEKHFLKVDCGEFQMEHEVAKLIGAPPGYLGHRETQPMITQAKLNAVTTENCGLSIVLFDEVEKAAPSLSRLLLGVLDRGALRLGDNSTVSFERTLIFMTSNLGAREMMRELEPQFGFEAFTHSSEQGVEDETAKDETKDKLEKIGLNAVRRKFPPEFVNRIDSVVTYQPLDAQALELILNAQLAKLQNLINTRHEMRAFQIDVDSPARAFLLAQGTSVRYGARELRRTIQRHILQPLAVMVSEGKVPARSTVHVTLSRSGESLNLTPVEPMPRLAPILDFARPVRKRRPYTLGSIIQDDPDAA